MDENTKAIEKKRIDKTIAALEKNNMKGYYAENTDELKKIITELIKEDKLITSGGSMTLKETGVIDFLRENYSGIFKDRADCLNQEETDRLFRETFSSDTFFASTNAVTENGELYNVDGTANRVAAMTFGPKQVIIVAGANKIVSDLKAAEERVCKLAAPANAVRLGIETACSKTGECVNCRNDSRICCTYVVMKRQRVKDRIKVIFLPDSYGY